jgi:hypothetical protein
LIQQLSGQTVHYINYISIREGSASLQDSSETKGRRIQQFSINYLAYLTLSIRDRANLFADRSIFAAICWTIPQHHKFSRHCGCSTNYREYSILSQDWTKLKSVSSLSCSQNSRFPFFIAVLFYLVELDIRYAGYESQVQPQIDQQLINYTIIIKKRTTRAKSAWSYLSLSSIFSLNFD